MSIVAIDVDAQQTFTPLCPNELPVVEGHLIVDELNQQALLADYRVLTKDAHSKHAVWVVEDACDMLKALPYPNADLCWLRHAEVGSDGFEAIPGLPQPEEYDFLVYKGVEKHLHPYGACFHDLTEKISTGLIEWLKVNQAKTLIIGGLATDYCVKNTVLQLLKHGDWQVILNLAACRGIAAQTTNQAIMAIQAAGCLVFNDSQEIKQQLF